MLERRRGNSFRIICYETAVAVRSNGCSNIFYYSEAKEKRKEEKKERERKEERELST